MTYLSNLNTAAENFQLIAKNIVVTEEYDQALKALQQEEFEPKIKALKITAIAILILGILIAATTGIVPGVLVSCLAVFPAINVKYLSDRKTILETYLQKKVDNIGIIFDSVIGFLKTHIENRDNRIVFLFNHNMTIKFHGSDHQSQAFEQLNGYLATHNANDHVLFDAKQKDECQQFAKLIPSVQSILNRKTPPAVPITSWEQLRKVCWQFRNVNVDFKDAPFSEQKPYIELGMDEKKSYQWVAKRIA